MKKRRSFPPVLAIVILGFTVYGAYALSTSISQRGQKLTEISENEKEIAVLKKDIENLQKEIHDSNSPQFVEKVAREDFGMVKPREIIYVDKDKQSENSNLQ